MPEPPVLDPYDFVSPAGDVRSLDELPLAPPVAAAISGAWPLRVAHEVQRLEGRTRLATLVRLEARPVLDQAWFDANGWVTRARGGALELRHGEHERLSIDDADGFTALTHELLAAPVDPFAAYEAVRRLPWLAPFAPLARPPAELKRFGLGVDHEHGRIGLFVVQHDLARLADDEAILRSGGFIDSDEEAVWCLEDRTRSLIWMGGVVYGYVGALPRVAGDWV